MPAPTLHTPRLTLRQHALADLEPLYAALGSEHARYMGGPFSRRDAWYILGAEAGSWDILGHGSWGVETRNGTFVGQVGINRPPHYPEAEIGWTLLPEAEGKGYATEATTAALHWAWENGFQTLVSYITPGNDRSIALAERLGAYPDPDAPLPEGETPEETVVYRHAPDTDGAPEAYA